MINRMIKRILYLALTAVMVLSLSACGATSSTKPGASGAPASSEIGKSYVLRFSANDAKDSTYDKLIIQPLQQKLQEKSGGRLSLEIYYSSSLAKQGQCLDGIKNGTVDMGVDVLTMYAGQYPYTELLGTPGIPLGDPETFTHLVQDYAKAFPEEGLANFVMISRFSSGTFGLLSTDKPWTKASDLAGKTMRATPNFIPWWQALGASATMIPMSDMYESFKLSVIKGAHTTIGAIDAFKFYEVTNGFTSLTMCGGDQVIAMSKPLYDSLPADLKQVIDDTSKEMLEVCIDYVKKSEQLTIEKVQAANPKFQFAEAEDIKGFSDAAMPLLEAKAAELDGKGLKGSEALKWLQDHAVE
jgi:TRAP-type C4-dicarboxylate transport system substrate-binding protein